MTRNKFKYDVPDKLKVVITSYSIHYTKLYDSKIGRKQEINETPIKQIAQEKNLLVLQPEKFTPEVIAELENIKPDLIVVAAYGKILPKRVLEIPKFGCLNVHPSLLPKFRGPSPVQNTS